MDASIVFRQVEGFGNHVQRPLHDFQMRKPPNDDEHGDHGNSHRIAHTLTACCRCRQRKTRCDPTLPRCLPCERSGSICEYFDTTKEKKISRYYVVKLQEKVRALETELGQYVDEEEEADGNDHEDFIRPGGLVKLNETDETPRYLGPSSGIAMTRIVMEEAKRYTDSGRISELIPDVKERRKNVVGASSGYRSQSFSIPLANPRKKSYPMVSAVAASGLPSRAIANRLVEVFHQRAQVFTPVIHERVLAKALEDAYAGSQDPFQNFVVRLVMAISMQKLDSNYAGLADSYYLAAMQYFEAVVRPKDIKTLQCLVLIGQYSLLTPTRTAVYYVAGLATRISQQLGLADEKTIALGASDPLALDMRRRLSWIVGTIEMGLSQSMGRPNGFAKTDDIVDIAWFETVPDSSISENGIIPGPPDEKKLVAIHFCKMRMLQAEIRRTLYEMKRPEPRNAQHPWFSAMEAKMDQWLNTSPEKPQWCKPWFTGRYHTMIVTLHRPSPQVPRPSVQSATKCFDSAAFVIQISSKQMMSAAVDITWVFLLTLYMALNTLLWSVARHPDIRAAHSREEVQELVNIALDIIEQCVERWPGTASASELYSILTKACLQSYDSSGTPNLSSPGSLNTPPSQGDSSSPNAMDLMGSVAVSKPGAPNFNPPQFGYVFGAAPESIESYSLDGAFPPHPTFRSNSIFLNPASNDHTGRRFSYFPPDFTQTDSLPEVDPSPPPSESTISPPPFISPPQAAQTPPESIPMQVGTPSMNTPLLSTPLLHHTTPSQSSPETVMSNTPTPQQRTPMPAFTIPTMPPGQLPQGQRPLPQANTVHNWFNPPPPFISPYTFTSNVGSGFWGNGGGGSGMNGFEDGGNFQGLPPERQGSLSQSQQIELMRVLEDEGMADIDTYLNTTSIGFGGDGAMGVNANMAMNWGPPQS
ncbi:hypothetical protein F4808DRAFT_73402 [Astrocystis sublimbata]|nr:hypothetical protein F4808DRAFT_73402 [Astrocystis sublimbata]